MASFVITAHNSDTTDASSYTPTVSIGSGGAERTIVISAGGRAVGAGIVNNGISVATIAAAEVVKHAVDAGSGRCHMVGMYIISAADLPDPTATSVALVISFSATIARCGWAVAVTSDPIDLTAFDTNSGGAAAAGTVNVPIDTPDDGAALGFAFDSNSGSPDLTWTNLTKDYEDASGEGGGAWTAAGADDTSATTGLAVSVAGSSNTAVIAIAASFASAVDVEEGEGTAAGTSTATGVARSLRKVAAAAAGLATVAGLAKALTREAGTAAGAAGVAGEANALAQGIGTAAGAASVTGVAQAFIVSGSGEHPLLIAVGADLQRGDTVSVADALSQAERLTDQGLSITGNTNLFG